MSIPSQACNWEGVETKSEVMYISPKRTAKQVLLGTLLGDGFIYYRWRNKNKPKSEREKTAQVRIKHSIKQLEYLNWKVKMLEPFLGKAIIRQLPKINAVEALFPFSKTAKIYFDDFYIETGSGGYKKIIRQNVLNRIHHPIALAVWFLDDGSKNGIISSQGFSKDENIRLIDLLQNKFGLKSTISKANGNGYRLRVWDEHKLSNIIKDIVFDIPSMRYKLSIDSAENKNKQISC